MSPGVTFERAYRELKRMLVDGELPPGTPIEPAVIGKQIASSITPIRDALHRLAGERLVEAPTHNGFRAPLLTEAALRDLYHWNGQLLGLAVKSMRASDYDRETPAAAPRDDVAVAIGRLFLRIARATGSSEQSDAISRLNDRLAPYRRVESQLLEGIEAEFDELNAASLNSRRLSKHLTVYHRRRIRAVQSILTCNL